MRGFMKHAAPRWAREVRKYIDAGDAESAFRIAEQMTHVNPRTIKSLGKGVESEALLHAGGLGLEKAVEPGLFVGKYTKVPHSPAEVKSLLEQTEVAHGILGSNAATLYGMADTPHAARYVEYLPGQANNSHLQDFVRNVTGAAPPSDINNYLKGNVPIPIRMQAFPESEQLAGLQRLQNAGYKANPAHLAIGDYHDANIGFDRAGNLKVHDPILLAAEGRMPDIANKVMDREKGRVFDPIRGEIGDALKQHKETSLYNPSGPPITQKVEQVPAGMGDVAEIMKRETTTVDKVAPEIAKHIAFLGTAVGAAAAQPDKDGKNELRNRALGGVAGGGTGYGLGYGLGYLLGAKKGYWR